MKGGFLTATSRENDYGWRAMSRYYFELRAYDQTRISYLCCQRLDRRNGRSNRSALAKCRGIVFNEYNDRLHTSIVTHKMLIELSLEFRSLHLIIRTSHQVKTICSWLCGIIGLLKNWHQEKTVKIHCLNSFLTGVRVSMREILVGIHLDNIQQDGSTRHTSYKTSDVLKEKCLWI